MQQQHHGKSGQQTRAANDIFSLQGKAIAVTTLSDGQRKYRVPGTDHYVTEFGDSVVYNDDTEYLFALRNTVNEYKGQSIGEHIVVDEIDAFIENQQYYPLGQRETYRQVGNHTVYNHYRM